MGDDLYSQYLREKEKPKPDSTSLYDRYLAETNGSRDTGDILLAPPPKPPISKLAAAKIARARGAVEDAEPESALMTGLRSTGIGVSTVARQLLHGAASIDESLGDAIGARPSKLAELATPIEKRLIHNEAALRPAEEAIGANPWASAGGETAGEFSASMLPFHAAGIAARPISRAVGALATRAAAGEGIAAKTVGKLAAGSGSANVEALKGAARALPGHAAVNVAPALLMDPSHNPFADPATTGFTLLGALMEGRAPHIVPRGDGGKKVVEGIRERLARVVHPEGAKELETTKEQRDVAQREADTDHLTGLGNQRAFKRARSSAEADPSTSIVRLDINGMKSVNDIHGHAAGDKLLTDVADAMRKAAAELEIGDRTFRIGGDEFNAIVPAAKAEAFRNRVEELVGVQDLGKGVKASISGGVGATDAAADAAAYSRKNVHKAEHGIVDPRAAGGIKIEPPTPAEIAAEKESGPAPSSRVVSHPVADLHVDPARFQFKLDVNEKGVGRHLASVEKFNPELAGSIAVWRDPGDGKTYVVNGHHRYDLAKRTGTKDMDVHYVDAPTAEIARAKGALMNIAEGQGTALDAAKFFRDTKTGIEDLRAEGVDLSGRVAKSALSLSKLEPDIFNKVASGKLSENHGAIIGAELELPEMQRAAAALVENSPKHLTDAQVRELVSQVRQAGTENVAQETLFGEGSEGTSLIYQRADVAAEIKKRLSSDKKLFGFVAKGTRGEELARGGNKIDVESSGQIARQSAILEEVFNSEAHAAGEVGRAITEAARRVANGEKLRTVVDDIYGPLREAVQRAIPGREAGRSAVREDTGPGGEPPAEGPQAGSGEGREAAGEVETVPPDPNQEALFAPVGNQKVERIRSAAWKAPDGKVYEAVTHHQAQYKAAIEGKADPEKMSEAGDGFTTTEIDPKTGQYRFVTRDEAYEIADRAEQIRAESQKPRRSLGSEDLKRGENREGLADDRDLEDRAVAAPAGGGKKELVINEAGQLDVFGEQPSEAKTHELDTPQGKVVAKVEPRGDRLEILYLGDAKHLDKEGGVLSSGYADENKYGPAVIRGLLRQLAKLYPEAKVADGVRVGGARGKMGQYEDVASFDLRPETFGSPVGERDLFGEKVASTEPDQSSLFGGQEGAAGSRNLKQTEAAARSELEKLREQLPRETDPKKKVRTAARISELEKLVNRDKAITSRELEARAIASEGEVGLFSPAVKGGPLRRRVSKILGREQMPDPEKVTALIDITRALAKATNPAVRQGRAMLKQRRALGLFFVKSEAIRVRRLDDVSTVAHEIGHYLSKNYLGNPTKRKPGKSGIFPGLKIEDPGKPSTSVAKIKLSSAAKDELLQMGKDLYGGRKPAGGYGEEGIAQYFSFYVVDPVRMAAEAPNFNAIMEAELFPKEPALKDALDQAQVDYADHVAAPPSARIDAMISVGETVRAKPSVRAIVHAMFDKLNEFKLAVDELGGERDPAKNAYTLSRLSAGDAGMAEEMIERGLTNWETGARESRGIAEILKEIPGVRIQAFRRYLVAERALEVSARGINAGIDLKDARATVDQLKAEFEQPAAELWDISQKLIDYRRDAGLLTDAEAEMIKEKNAKRVGFYRVFEEGEMQSKGGGAGSGFGRNSSGIQKMRGSARKIIDPLESIITDVYKTVHQAKTHEVMRTLVDHARKTEGGARVAEVLTERPQHLVKIPIEKVINQLLDLGFEIPENMPEAKVLELATGVLEDFQFNAQAGPRETKDMVIPYIKDGERFWVQLKDRRLYDSIKGLDREQMPMWMRALSWPTRTLRAGATLSIEFIGRNPVRDSFDAALYSQGGFKPPGFHFAKGLFSLVKKDALYQQWRLDGGDNAAMAALDRPTVQKSLKEFIRSGPKQLVDVVIHPINTLRMLSSITENATRIGEYKIILEKELAAGMPKASARKAAAFGSRDLTIDFLRSGSVGKNINQIVAFFNANLQGSAKMVRELRTRPGTVIPRILASITMPSLAIWALQKDDPAYREIPRWQKDLFWIWVDRGEDGKVEHIWRIPKPFEVGVLFGSGPERIAEWLDKHDPGAFDSFLKTVMGSVTPGVLPTGVQPLIENWANKSWFRDRNVVPRSVERFDKAHQAGRYASETARQLGQLFNYPPAKIDNMIRGWGGGLATDYIVKATDVAIRGARRILGKEALSPAASREKSLPEQIPGVRGFMVREPGYDAESVERVYRTYAEAEARRQTWKNLLETGRKREARVYFNDHKEEILSVVTSEDAGTSGKLRAAYTVIGKLQDVAHDLEGADMPAAARKEKLRLVYDAMIKVAQKATGRDIPSDPLPDPVNLELDRVGLKLEKIDPGIRKIVAATMASAEYRGIDAIAEQLVEKDPKYRDRDRGALARELKKGQIEGAVAAYRATL